MKMWEGGSRYEVDGSHFEGWLFASFPKIRPLSNINLGGGFKYVLFVTPSLGFHSLQFDVRIFFNRVGSTTN